MLAQLLGGDCAVPHWGYFIEGSATVHYSDRQEEPIEAGQLFSRHSHRDRVMTEHGILIAEFSPADGARRLSEDIARHLAGRGATRSLRPNVRSRPRAWPSWRTSNSAPS